MGYFFISEAGNAVPATSLADPKTHTPGSQVQERGYRYYSPTLGRWLSRDPLEEISWFGAVRWLARVGMTPGLSPASSTRNLYDFLLNDSVNLTDSIGLQATSQPPKEGDPCCNSCKLTATFERVSVKPTLTGGGCTRQRATSWSITVRVNYSGDCPVLGCKYWTCNTRRPTGTPSAYTTGSCGGWTYEVGGPAPDPDSDYHAKAMEGVIVYLTCENGKWVKKELSAGTLETGFYYDPPGAYAGPGRPLWP